MAAAKRTPSLAHRARTYFEYKYNTATAATHIALHNTYPMSKLLHDIGGCQSPKAKPKTMEGNGVRANEKKNALDVIYKRRETRGEGWKEEGAR